MDFIDTIDKLGLKANSAKNYVRSLTRLQKLYEMPLTQAISEDSELTTFNKLFDGKSHHTKKSYLVAVHAFICGKKHGNGAECDNVHAAPFHKAMGLINEGIIKINEKQTKTPKQADNWATIDELKGLMLKYEAESQGLLSKDEVSMKEIIEFQKYVIMSLYLGDDANPPIRSEYGDMIVAFKKDKPTLSTDKNYLLVTGPRKKEFILNDYKTSETYGKKTFKVGKSLNKVLNNWLKIVEHQTGDPLLLKPTGGVLGRNGLSKMLMLITNPLGKRISVQMLRHIFISENIKQPTLTAKKALADKMCHSVSVQEVYIKSGEPSISDVGC